VGRAVRFELHLLLEYFVELLIEYSTYTGSKPIGWYKTNAHTWFLTRVYSATTVCDESKIKITQEMLHKFLPSQAWL